MGIPLYTLTGCFTEISSVQLPQKPTSPFPAVACMSIPKRPVEDLPSKKGKVAELYLSETTGKFRYSIGGNYVSKDFDNNDLGINFQTNYYALNGNINYRILKATDKLNAFRVNLGWFSQFHNESNYLQEQYVNFNLKKK